MPIFCPGREKERRESTHEEREGQVRQGFLKDPIEQ